MAFPRFAFALFLFAVSLASRPAVTGAAGAPRYFPPRSLFPPYAADPRSPRFSSEVMDVRPTGKFIENAIGGHVPVIGWTGMGGRLEWALWTGTWARYDFHENLDLRAEDFRAGTTLAYQRGPWAFKLQTYHESDHLGDEYVLRTGADRIAYRREDLALGIARTWRDAVRVYAEAAHGFALGPPNKPGRWQAGVEWEGASAWIGPFRPYAAVNLRGTEETRWALTATTQAGLFFSGRDNDRALRISVIDHRGRETLGQFFHERLRYTSIRLSLEI